MHGQARTRLAIGDGSASQRANGEAALLIRAGHDVCRTMEDLARYLDAFVEPTIKDFESNPTSPRHAFLACVATFHAVDYLEFPRRRSSQLLQQFRRESPDFAIIDNVAHAFKHVQAGDRANPRLKAAEVIARPPAVWGQMVWDLSRWDDALGGVTLDNNREVDLLDALRQTVAFLRAKTQGPP
jgi:hypothetical protein